MGALLSSRATRSLPGSGTANQKSGEPAETDDDIQREQIRFTLQSDTPLLTRYDLDVSINSPWRRSLELSSPSSATERIRTRTSPPSFPHFPRRVRSSVTDKRTFIELKRGSPRIFDVDDLHVRDNKLFFVSSEVETPVLSAVGLERRARNHQRRYFDLCVSPSPSGVRRTPPGCPFGAPYLSPYGAEVLLLCRVVPIPLLWCLRK